MTGGNTSYVLQVSPLRKVRDSFIFSLTWLATECSLALTNGPGEFTTTFFRVITWSENQGGLFLQNAGKLVVPDCTVSVRMITVQLYVA
jgi:hypothetical protein